MQSKFGKMITAAEKKKIAAAKAEISSEAGSPFAGPVVDQDGKVLFADGVIPTYAEIEATDVFVKGVQGDIPKS